MDSKRIDDLVDSLQNDDWPCDVCGRPGISDGKPDDPDVIVYALGKIGRPGCMLMGIIVAHRGCMDDVAVMTDAEKEAARQSLFGRMKQAGEPGDDEAGF